MNEKDFKNLLSKPTSFKQTQPTPEMAPESTPVTPVSDACLPRLNIGSGPNVFPFRGWINYDREDISEYLKYLDWQDDTKTLAYKLEEMPKHQQRLAQFIRSSGMIDFRVHDLRKGFAHHTNDSIESIYCGQMFEHLNMVYEVPKFLSECRRILKPGGVLRMTTPDLDILIKAYMNNDMSKFASEQPEFYTRVDSSAQLAMIMFGASGEGCTQEHFDGHFFCYTQKSMTTALKNSGFRDVEFYDETGKSKDPVMAMQVEDFGLSHSMIVECVK